MNIQLPMEFLILAFTAFMALETWKVRLIFTLDKRIALIEQEMRINSRAKALAAGRTLSMFAAGLLACYGLTGCEFDPIQAAPQVREETVTIPETKTSVTNDTGGVTTIIVPAQVVKRTETNLVYSVAPQWDTAIKTVQGVNAVIPSPASPFVSLGLGALSAVLAWVVRIKNKQASLADVLIEGIEKANNPDVKKIIQTVATAYGKQADLHAEVVKRTQ